MNPRYLEAVLTEKRQLSEAIFSLRFHLPCPLGDISPGQFALIEAPGVLLPRPLSIFYHQGREVSFLLQVVGEGTASLSRLPLGEKLSLLLPLGRGFPLPEGGERVVMVAGGIGIASLYPLALASLKKGASPLLLWGGRSSSHIPPSIEADLRRRGIEVMISTEDGSRGEKGMVTDLIKGEAKEGSLYACGPKGMLKRVAEICQREGRRGWLSLEERMACGMGACLGCVIMTVYGPKRVCKDGPVFPVEEIAWREIQI